MKNLKIGICEWAMPTGGLTGIELAAEIGLEGIELDYGDYEKGFPLSNPRIQNSYLKCAEKNKIEFPSMALNALNLHGMCHPIDSYDGVIALKAIQTGLLAAKNMGIHVVQLPSFDSGEIKSEQDFFETCEKLKIACDLAEKYDLIIAAENVLSAERTLQMIDEVGSKRLRILFDTQNYYLQRGYSTSEVLSEIYPFVEQIHIKDGYNKKISSRLLGTGDVSIRETAEVVRKTECTTWLLLENYYHMQPLSNLAEDPIMLIEQDLKTARDLFAFE